jgi:hypothetical protein
MYTSRPYSKPVYVDRSSRTSVLREDELLRVLAARSGVGGWGLGAGDWGLGTGDKGSGVEWYINRVLDGGSFCLFPYLDEDGRGDQMGNNRFV